QQVFHHVENEQRAHPVVGETLPHLGREQEGEPARMAEKVARGASTHRLGLGIGHSGVLVTPAYGHRALTDRSRLSCGRTTHSVHSRAGGNPAYSKMRSCICSGSPLARGRTIAERLSISFSRRAAFPTGRSLPSPCR